MSNHAVLIAHDVRPAGCCRSYRWQRSRSAVRRSVLPAAAVLLLLAGCASVEREPTADRWTTADRLAQQGRLVRSSVPADGFTLTTYSRIEAPGQPVQVYIEGDGLAWISRSRPSSDPTPRRPVALELAAADPAPNVLYLARPCQYVDLRRAACDSAYWTGKRYSEEVLRAMDQALDTLLAPTPNVSVNLIGYSGGAAIAVLLAARRHDVASLRTVAGNLDSEAVNRYHGVSAMPQSLNPIDAAPGLAHLPQIHFVGAQDDVVSGFITASFARRTRNTACVHIVKVADAAHDKGWQKEWPYLLGLPVSCDAEAGLPSFDVNSTAAGPL